MSALAGILLALAGLVMGLLAGRRLGRRPDPPAAPRSVTDTRQILLPFTGNTLSRRAFEAALRLARVEGATLMLRTTASVGPSATA